MTTLFVPKEVRAGERRVATTEALVAVDRRFENVQVYPLGLAPRQWWVPAAMQRYRQDAERLENRKCF